MDIPSTCMATYTFKLSSDGDNSFPKVVKTWASLNSSQCRCHTRIPTTLLPFLLKIIDHLSLSAPKFAAS